MSKSEKLASVGELLSSLVHDLREPLMGIKGTVEIMKLENGNMDDKTKTQFERLEVTISKMSYQLEDVLDFVDTSELHLENKSISQILISALDHVEKPDDVKIQLPKNDAKLRCDSKKFERVSVNLIKNAIEAMEGRGDIKIRIKDYDSRVLIEFENSGPDIPPDIFPTMFEPLFTTKRGGTGLGLPTCKNVIEQHGGTITVKNNPTTFTIQLPKVIMHNLN